MAIPTVPPQSGGHEFPLILSSDGAPATETSRRRSAAPVVVLAIALVAAGCAAALQWGANVHFDDSLDSFESALADTESFRDSVAALTAAAAETTVAGSSVASAETGYLMAPAATESLNAAIAEALHAEATTTALRDAPFPTAPDKPQWAWELIAAATQLDTDRTAVIDRANRLADAVSATTAASAALEEAGLAAVTSAATAAGAFEAAHVSARNTDILSLRHASEWLLEATTFDAKTADAYVDLESAAVAMIASEQSEIAEKQGALYSVRLEVEAFARELAPDVLLDFDWSRIVNGYGEGDSMAGYATWWHGDPGYANIELTDSVAALWPSERSRALVAHEVGHAISVKCSTAYDASTQENIEAWATAWAISMGFDDPANGTSAYGAPSQEMIDAAAGCR